LTRCNIPRGRLPCGHSGILLVLALTLASLAGICPALGVDASFEGRYRVGPTSCTVAPVRMACSRFVRADGKVFPVQAMFP
jgi:hypothetical protein